MAEVSMYYPLEQGQIRLLHIQPGNRYDPIKCNLEVVTLASSSQSYETLSYTWAGGTGSPGTITVSGQLYDVATNLLSALKHLRPKDLHGPARTCWIDAICINQHDPDERSQQVKMMADIYRSASLVVMWLGEETVYDSDGVSVESIAFSLLKQIQGVFEKYGRVDLDFYQTGPSSSPLCPGYGLPDASEIEWVALARVFSKPYFERMWIIQEVVMATKAIVVCGELEVGWEVLRDFARSVHKGGVIGILQYDDAAPGIISVNAMAHLKNGSGLDLIPLLAMTRGYHASVEVDKVFALMGLAANSHDVGVQVDYSMAEEPFRLWEGLALHSLMAHKSLLCLSNTGIAEGCSNDIPSWIPNWNDRDEGRSCIALHGKDQFRASKDTIPSLSISADRKTLTVEGYIVDSVKVIAPVLPPFKHVHMKSGPLDVPLTTEEDHTRIALFAANFQNAREIAKSAFQIPEGVSRDTELARTLCCDISPTGHKADIEKGYKVLQYWIKLLELYARSEIPATGETEKREALKLQVRSLRPPGVDMHELTHGGSMLLFGKGRSVCATESGDLGLVASGARPGDLVCILKGGLVPYLLREEGEIHRLVGECFVNGIMYGEAYEGNDLKEKEFRIR